jgi:hypothetical protein
MSRTFLREEPVSVSTMCQHRLLPQKLLFFIWNTPKHAQTNHHQMSSPWWRNLWWRNNQHHHQMSRRDDEISSSKVLGRFPTIKSITGRWLSYRKANSKTVRLYARQKFPGFERGSGCSLIHNSEILFIFTSMQCQLALWYSTGFLIYWSVVQIRNRVKFINK